MRRLTKVDEKGNWQHIEGVGLVEYDISLYGALCKLKDYEDTGLSPKEINDLNTFDRSQAMIATEKLQEEQRKHRWIPVLERLPEVSTEVLVTEFGAKGVYVTTDEWDGDRWEGDGDVVAWMPLLEPCELQLLRNAAEDAAQPLLMRGKTAR